MKFCSYKTCIYSMKLVETSKPRAVIAHNLCSAVAELNNDINRMSESVSKGLRRSAKRG